MVYGLAWPGGGSTEPPVAKKCLVVHWCALSVDVMLFPASDPVVLVIHVLCVLCVLDSLWAVFIVVAKSPQGPSSSSHPAQCILIFS